MLSGRHHVETPATTFISDRPPSQSSSSISSLLLSHHSNHHSAEVTRPYRYAPSFAFESPSRPEESCYYNASRSKEIERQERKAAETLMALSLVVDHDGSTSTPTTHGGPREILAPKNHNHGHPSYLHHAMKQRQVTTTPYSHHRVFSDNFHQQEESIWRRHFEELAFFARQNGHFSVYRLHPLYRWVNEQRLQYFRMRIGGLYQLDEMMTPERCRALQGMGFPFIHNEWYRGLDQFLRFKQQYGCLSKLSSWTVQEDPRLRDWLYKLKTSTKTSIKKSIYKKKPSGHHHSHQMELLKASGILDDEELQKLPDTPVIDAISNVVKGSSKNCPPHKTQNRPINMAKSLFDVRWAITWTANFDQLCDFKNTHGHIMVGRSHPELGRWVAWQRVQYTFMKTGRRHSLNPERIASLNSLGFVWDRSTDARWMGRYEDLMEYKKIHGDCLVPQRCCSNPGLGSWVAGQRRLYRLMRRGGESSMTATRVELLERIGFIWCTRSA